jgi:hypothetical protein
MADELSGFEGTNPQAYSYVLPQSRTTGYFMQLANEKAQERRQQALYQQKLQEKANDEYAQHLYAYKTPEIANAYTKWLQPQFDDYLQKATEYHAQTGKDPFTNPTFIQHRNDLQTLANSTDQANKHATALATALADKSKNYSQESKQAATDWLNNYYKNPVGSLYSQPPTLQQRDLDLNDAIKLGHATPMVMQQGGYMVTAPNTHNHVVQGQQILSQPEFEPLLQKYGINTHVGDAFGVPNDKGGTIYPTDPAAVNVIADHVLQNAQQPHYAATLQAAGIDPADPHAKDKLTELVTQQNNGYGRVLNEFKNRLDANVESKKVRDYAPDRLALSQERLDLSRERFEAAKDKQNAGLQATPLTTNYVEPARTGGVPEVQKWLDLAPKGQFKPGEKPTVSIQNGYQTINIPDQVQLDNKIVAKNKQAEAAYNASPEGGRELTNPSTWFGKKPSIVPYKQSEKYKEDVANGDYVDPYKVVKPGYTETLDPNDAAAYHAKAGEINSNLKIPVKAINEQAGGKAGRGVNPGIKNVKPTAKDPLGLGL